MTLDAFVRLLFEHFLLIFLWNLRHGTFKKHSYLQEIFSMKSPFRSTLDPHKDVKINNTQKESEFREFDFTPLWLGLGL